MPAIPYEILKRYDQLLENKGWAVKCEPVPGTQPWHLRWMLSKILNGELYGEDEKAHRWLGFIQGVIIMRGWATVQEERDFTRSFFKPERKADTSINHEQ